MLKIEVFSARIAGAWCAVGTIRLTGSGGRKATVVDMEHPITTNSKTRTEMEVAVRHWLDDQCEAARICGQGLVHCHWRHLS